MKTFRLRDTEEHVTDQGVEAGTRVVGPHTVLVLIRGMTLHNDVPICVTTREMAFNQDVKALVPKPEVICNSFFPYLVLALKPRLLSLVGSASHGTGRILSDQLRDLTVQLPPRPEQRAIARALGALDDKIELNREVNRTLEATAQALFKSWFVDFDPVVAKADGRKPYGMSEEIAALFPDRFVESELGSIPEGWKQATVADIADYVNGRNFTKNATGAGRMVIRISELNSGPSSSTVYNEVETEERHTAYPDDILFAWSGSLDVYRWHRPEAVVNQHIFKVICKEYPKWFVYYQLKTAMPFFQMIAAGKATTMGHIKRGHLGEAELALPPDEIVEGASEIIAPLYDLIHVNELQSQTLANLRDLLLPKLLSGEIRVGEAEEAVEAVGA